MSSDKHTERMPRWMYPFVLPYAALVAGLEICNEFAVWLVGQRLVAATLTFLLGLAIGGAL